MNPYVDSNGVRVFSHAVDEDELIWHRDKEDRVVHVIESNGWSFQFDNELPYEMFPRDTLFIPKMTYHRIIKSKDCVSDLVLKIEKRVE